MLLADMKIGPRVLTAFALLFALMVVVTSVVTVRLTAVRDSSDRMVRENLERINQAQVIAPVTRDVIQACTMMLLTKDRGEIQRLEDIVKTRTLDAKGAVGVLARLATTPQSRTELVGIAHERTGYLSTVAGFMHLVNQGKTAQASTYMTTTLLPAFTTFSGQVDALAKAEKAQANGAAAYDERAYVQGRTIVIAVGLLAIAISILLAVAITRSITRPLGRAVRVAGALASGDLSGSIEAPSKDEVGEVLRALGDVVQAVNGISNDVVRLAEAAARGDFTARGNAAAYTHTFATIVNRLNALMETTQDGLGEIGRIVGALTEGDLTTRMRDDVKGSFAEVRGSAILLVERLTVFTEQIRGVVDQLSTAAGQITAGTSDLSQRTEEQASSLEETASSMEELTSTVKANGENARQADRLAVSARDIATSGGAIVSQVVGTMAEMDESSRKIADIIGVIDGIAFQTNILALNAAVEAARAGEQGRGFAVVAGEVRNLAQRSAGAAREIKELINDAVAKTEAGSALVDDAGRTMSEIVTSVRRVTDIVAEITAASLEQGEGIEQVNQAIVQMDRAAQQNAALVEESAAAATSLEEQSQRLVETVAALKLH